MRRYNCRYIISLSLTTYYGPLHTSQNSSLKHYFRLERLLEIKIWCSILNIHIKNKTTFLTEKNIFDTFTICYIIFLNCNNNCSNRYALLAIIKLPTVYLCSKHVIYTIATHSKNKRNSPEVNTKLTSVLQTYAKKWHGYLFSICAMRCAFRL